MCDSLSFARSVWMEQMAQARTDLLFGRTSGTSSLPLLDISLVTPPRRRCSLPALEVRLARCADANRVLQLTKQK